MHMGRLQGRVAIVTGGASGIGAACARRLAQEGAQVVVADIFEEGARRLALELQQAGGAALAVQVDIGEETSVRAMIDLAVNRYGGLDVLVNNAADTHLSRTRDAPVESTDTEVWDAILRVNLRGTMLCCKHAIPHLRARGGGSIVNLSSGAALAGANSYSAYAASKAGVIALTQYVATQHGKEGIRCNAIAPGLVVTPATVESYASSGVGDMMLSHHLTPRLGKPEDIAAAIIFLAGDEAAFITGHTLAVDGGLLAHQPYIADIRRMTSAPGS
jgi:NAD(P)-dependent dehydrogenase (short-subunit alcohol dehydrogenase family)